MPVYIIWSYWVVNVCLLPIRMPFYIIWGYCVVIVCHVNQFGSHFVEIEWHFKYIYACKPFVGIFGVQSPFFIVGDSALMGRTDGDGFEARRMEWDEPVVMHQTTRSWSNVQQNIDASSCWFGGGLNLKRNVGDRLNLKRDVGEYANFETQRWGTG
jgi:hypothetical protein